MLLLSVVFALPSCVELENPLCEPEQTRPDERLVGAWQASEGEFWFIGKASQEGVPPGIMAVWRIEFDQMNRVIAGSNYFYSCQIGKDHFASLVLQERIAQDQKWEKADAKSCLFAKYTVEQDRLSIWQLSRDAVATAIKKGRIKGKIGQVGPFFFPIEDVSITDTMQNSQIFVARYSAELFTGEPLVLKRMRN